MSDYKIPCEFEFEAEEMDESPAGHFATGDKDLDDRLVTGILDRLSRGQLEAWFIAKVTCRGVGDAEGFSGVAYLGACSYDSFEDFKEDCYYTCMCADAYNNMIAEIKAVAEKAEQARKLLANAGL